jgi:hypothetical protein
MSMFQSLWKPGKCPWVGLGSSGILMTTVSIPVVFIKSFQDEVEVIMDLPAEAGPTARAIRPNQAEDNISIVVTIVYAVANVSSVCY